MLRPSILRGMPAFGWAASGLSVRRRMRSMASSMATGPTLQLQPITSTPQSISLEVKVSGLAPSRQLPSSSMVTCATNCMAGALRARQDCLMQLLQVAKSF